mgnify:CR=1 FL=1
MESIGEYSVENSVIDMISNDGCLKTLIIITSGNLVIFKFWIIKVDLKKQFRQYLRKNSNALEFLKL